MANGQEIWNLECEKPVNVRVKKTVASELVLTLQWISRNSILSRILVQGKTTTPKKKQKV
jgi:hypothetical protein